MWFCGATKTHTKHHINKMTIMEKKKHNTDERRKKVKGREKKSNMISPLSAWCGG